MPVSIGIGPNKTLAKVASHFAKRYRGYHHCCLIDTDAKSRKALSLYDVAEVWGIAAAMPTSCTRPVSPPPSTLLR